MTQIVGFEDIVGLAGSEYGPSEVAGREQSTVLLAKDLPKSMVGIPMRDPIGPSLTDEIHIDVQREFRPDRLMLFDVGNEATTPEQQDLCRLVSLSIGDTNLNASPNPVPMAVFSNVSVGTSIRAPRTTDPSLGMDMMLENGNPAGEGAPSWTPAGGFFGPSARPGRGAGGTRSSGIVGAADASADPAELSSDDARNLPQSFVGLPYTAAPALALTRVSIQCQIFRDVRPDRLVVGQGGLNDWMIRDVRVATTSLNASPNPIPGIAFANLSFGCRLRATVTATPSVGITIDAFSLATGPNTDDLCGAFFGPSRFPST